MQGGSAYKVGFYLLLLGGVAAGIAYGDNIIRTAKDITLDITKYYVVVGFGLLLLVALYLIFNNPSILFRPGII